MMLQVQEIDTFYGLVHMLRGISLEVAAGEVVALLGRNGAGKTTVIKSIMGLAPPRAGRILFKGEDITGLPPHAIARRGVSYVPASRGIFSALTARENLEIVRTKGSRWNPEGIFRLFRGWNRSRAGADARSPAGSSRCWPSGAPSSPIHP